MSKHRSLATSADDSSSGEALYGYVPSRTLGFIFVGVYLATTGTPSRYFSLPITANSSPALHGWQALRSRGWWLLPTVFIAGIAEVVGWAARLKSSYDPSARMPFIIQYVSCLALYCAVVPFLTCILGHLSLCLRRRPSLLPCLSVLGGSLHVPDRNIVD